MEIPVVTLKQFMGVSSIKISALNIGENTLTFLNRHVLICLFAQQIHSM